MGALIAHAAGSLVSRRQRPHNSSASRHSKQLVLEHHVQE